MLLAVAPNPALDRTLHVPLLVPGTVHRTDRVVVSAGGKGLNVARAARHLGCPVRVNAPLAGKAGRQLADLAEAEGLDGSWWWMEGETRTCVLLTHDDRDATVVNEAGPRFPPEAWEGFLEHVRQDAASARAVAVAGSLPPGADPAATLSAWRDLSREDRLVLVDTSGEALREAVREPAGLILKINREELSAAVEGDDLKQAAREIVARGARLVVVTAGAAQVLVEGRGVSGRVLPPPVEAVSSVGSGDSFLAGLAARLMEGADPVEATEFAAACGAANARTADPAVFELDDVERLRRRPVAPQPGLGLGRRNYEQFARRYAEGVETKPHNAYYERPALRSLVGDVAGLRLLDAGCGSGVNTGWFAGHGAEVVGFDATPEMVDLARRRVGASAELSCADMEEPLPFPDRSFDVVVCALALDYVLDWRPVLAEFARVLRPGGRLVFSCGHPVADLRIWRERFDAGSNYFQVELGSLAWSGFGEPRPVVSSYRRPLAEIVNPLIQAGLTVERIVEPLPTEEFRQAHPRGYELLSRDPGFLLVRAVRP